MGSEDTDEDPVVAYALATGALLAAASLMCVVLMFCAKCPEWRKRRRSKLEKEKLLMHCTKVKFSTKLHSKSGVPGCTCAVCLEDFKEREQVVVCPCNHGYHKSCLSEWVVQSPCCPLCKSLISSSNKGACPVTIAPQPSEATPLMTA